MNTSCLRLNETINLIKNNENTLEEHIRLSSVFTHLNLDFKTLRAHPEFADTISSLKKENRAIGDKFNRLIKKALRLKSLESLIRDFDLQKNDQEQNVRILKCHTCNDQFYNLVYEFESIYCPDWIMKVKNAFRLVKARSNRKKINFLIKKLKTAYENYEKLECRERGISYVIETCAKSNMFLNSTFYGEEKARLKALKSSNLNDKEIRIIMEIYPELSQSKLFKNPDPNESKTPTLLVSHLLNYGYRIL